MLGARATEKRYPYSAAAAFQTAQELGIPFVLKDVSLTDKPAWFSELYATAVGADSSSTGKVPVLVDGPLVLAESAVIAEYLINKFGPEHAGETALSPTALSPEAQARTRIFVEQVVSNVRAWARSPIRLPGPSYLTLRKRLTVCRRFLRPPKSTRRRGASSGNCYSAQCHRTHLSRICTLRGPVFCGSAPLPRGCAHLALDRATRHPPALPQVRGPRRAAVRGLPRICGCHASEAGCPGDAI